MIRKYKKKPIIVEAMCFLGIGYIDELKHFVGDALIVGSNSYDCKLKTLEGDMTFSKFDYIIKGVNGEFYPCRPDIFEKTYQDAEGKMNREPSKSKLIEDEKIRELLIILKADITKAFENFRYELGISNIDKESEQE